jgi:hypothetical protein
VGELVALHTQHLVEPAASSYLSLLGRAIRAARLSKTFPDRRRLDATLRALEAEAHRGLYEGIFVDSRSGLPNMASFTRALADKSVGIEALQRYEAQVDLDARASDHEIYARMANKRRYYETLGKMHLAPVDEHRVLLRRHEPAASRASFRVELTKLSGSGQYLRVVIELTQTSGLWAHRLVELDEFGEVAHGTAGLRSMVYRFAGYDAETLFIRLHELDGVQVERVQRGLIGPVLWSVPGRDGQSGVAEPETNALTEAWTAAWAAGKLGPGQHLVASFATDIAAIDVKEEKSNDPLSPLLASAIREQERARYRILRERHPFRVYKDRKFAATPGLVALVTSVCTALGSKNLVYPVR